MLLRSICPSKERVGAVKVHGEQCRYVYHELADGRCYRITEPRWGGILRHKMSAALCDTACMIAELRVADSGDTIGADLYTWDTSACSSYPT
ncbi:hypothetical protein M8818_002364 [Zalaria obscura]|uniref:Uncharacterized protein n=1 Tax=Zalaria obscura TaxID=2024903 RepID=A0ACC3SKQ8_9PEZI